MTIIFKAVLALFALLACADQTSGDLQASSSTLNSKTNISTEHQPMSKYTQGRHTHISIHTNTHTYGYTHKHTHTNTNNVQYSVFRPITFSTFCYIAAFR